MSFPNSEKNERISLINYNIQLNFPSTLSRIAIYKAIDLTSELKNFILYNSRSLPLKNIFFISIHRENFPFKALE